MNWVRFIEYDFFFLFDSSLFVIFLNFLILMILTGVRRFFCYYLFLFVFLKIGKKIKSN